MHIMRQAPAALDSSANGTRPLAYPTPCHTPRRAISRDDEVADKNMKRFAICDRISGQVQLQRRAEREGSNHHATPNTQR